MGGFIIGIALAIVILVIIKLASYFKNKRKLQKTNDNSVINLEKNTTDNNEVEKGE